MSENPLGADTFLHAIDRLTETVEGLSDEQLTKIAQSPALEEVVFNVLAHYRHVLKQGETISDELFRKLTLLAEERMEFLRPMFEGMPAGRDVPGKMEYDTTLQELRRLQENRQKGMSDASQKHL